MGKTKDKNKSYFYERDKSNTKDHASMNSTRKTVENSANRVDNLPKWKNDKPTHRHNVSKLAPRVVGFKHFQV